MKVNEILLLEMSTVVDRFVDENRNLVNIVIYTGNEGGGPAGQTEHYPAHIHVEIRKLGIDIPLELGSPYLAVLSGGGHKIRGKLTAKQHQEVMNRVAPKRNQYIALFNKAMHQTDPNPQRLYPVIVNPDE